MTSYTIRNASNTSASVSDISRAKAAFRRFYKNPAKSWGKHHGDVCIKFTDINGTYAASFLNEIGEEITDSFELK